MADLVSTFDARALPIVADPRGTWVHLVPAGTFKGRDGRGPFVADDMRSLLAATRAYAGKHPLPIDYDHGIDLAARTGKPGEAAGWINGLQIREDGLWGQVEWTARASAHIAAGEFRYISPVIEHDAQGVVKRLLRAALTNNPNLGQLKALFSAQVEPQAMEEFLNELRKRLGLKPDADNAAILAKIGSAGGEGGAPDPAKYVPIEEFEKVVAELNDMRQGVSRQSAEEHVEKHIRNANMPSYLRGWSIALCCANKPAFDAFIERTKGAFNRIAAHSGTSALPPDRIAADTLSEFERQVSRSLGLTAEEFVKSKSFIEKGRG